MDVDTRDTTLLASIRSIVHKKYIINAGNGCWGKLPDNISCCRCLTNVDTVRKQDGPHLSYTNDIPRIVEPGNIHAVCLVDLKIYSSCCVFRSLPFSLVVPIHHVVVDGETLVSLS